MAIRQVTKNDIGACAEVFMAAYNKMPWNYNWGKAKAEKYLSEYFHSPQFVGYLYCEGTEVLGAFFAHSKTWWTNDQLFIDELFVASNSQGKGIGKQLMAEAEKHCEANDLGTLALMTNKFMPSLKFYDSIDFTKVDQFVFMFKQV